MRQTATEERFGGFSSFGEYLLAVSRAGPRGQLAEERLIPLAAAPGTLGSEAAGADGGFAVPPAWSESIFEAVASPTTIFGRTTWLPSDRMQLNVPISPQAPWATGADINTMWTSEAQAVTPTKIALANDTLRARKVITLIGVTDELVEDGPALAAFLQMEAPRRIAWKVDDAILNGDGVGKPRGVVSAPCTIVQTKESAQASGTIVAANIEKMATHLDAGSFSNAIWAANPDCLPQLAAIGWPLFAPRGTSGFATDTLLGREIIWTEAAQALGNKADLTLLDPTRYVTIRRSRSDASIHCWFDYDVTAFRFTLRVDGMASWPAPVTPPHSATARSMCVVLEAR